VIYNSDEDIGPYSSTDMPPISMGLVLVMGARILKRTIHGVLIQKPREDLLLLATLSKIRRPIGQVSKANTQD
jgi:hypothetical protein